MPKVKKLTVWVESKPGELGRITKALGEAKLNITAFGVYTNPAGGDSPVGIQVSSPARAKKILGKLGVRFTEEEVLRITVPDKPGVLGEIGTRLGQANVNIEYAYATTTKGSRKSDVLLKVSDLAAATKALRGL
jgi:hypothetical protein